jgi:ABC-type branched-subunit amino acid transport system ATPase component/branched-subunit amino acid ABC-type transport system permease component
VTAFLTILLAGLGSGAVYAALSLGLVITYKGTGVINFAAGAMGAWSGYVYSQLRASGSLVFPVVFVHPSVHLAQQVPVVPAVLISVVCGVLLGLAVHVLVFRPLRSAPVLAKVVASAGVMLALQALIVQRFGSSTIIVAPVLPPGSLAIGGVTIPQDVLWLAAIVAAVAVAAGAWFRYSRTGLALRAAAEDPRTAAFAGLSTDRLAAVSWMLASGVAGFMVVLAAPVTGLSATGYALYVVPALACALAGRLSSIGPAVIAGLVLGMIGSELTYLSSQPWWPSWAGTGVSSTVPLLAVIVVLFLLGKSLPARDSAAAARLPAVPVVRHRFRLLAGLLLVGLAALLLTGGSYRFGVITSMIMGVVALSFVVLTGLLGQVSFAQAAFAGVGGFALSKLATSAGLGFPWAPVLAALIAAALGLVVGLPALRIRGSQLAVVTLALGLAFEQAVFSNTSLSGIFGAVVPPPLLPGLDLSVRGGSDTARLGFGMLCLLVLTLAAGAVANLTRSGTGQRMLAVRSNERVSASIGISVTATKLTGFTLSAFIAGLGGALIGYSYGSVSVASFTALTGLAWLMLAYLGGITSIGGALTAGTLATLGIAFVVINRLVPMSGNIYQLIAAAALILTAIFNPEGIAGAWRQRLHRRARPAPGPDAGAPASASASTSGRALPPEAVDAAAARTADRLADQPEGPLLGAPGHPAYVPARETETPHGPALRLSGITVRYGGMVAADAVSLEIRPGQIVGLIGANGAGKTTLLDAISGFARYSGSVQLAGQSIDTLPAHRRARRGLARTWQATELFADLTVTGNLAVAARPARPGALILDLLRPGHGTADRAADGLLGLAGLAGLAQRLPSQLTLAEQKIVSVARALALRPQVLLLDEPAAGLSAAQAGELARELRGIVARQNLGILLVEHDVSLIMSVCDYIYVLDFGKLIAAGPPATVRTDPAVIAAYLGHAAGPGTPASPVPGPAGACARGAQ